MDSVLLLGLSFVLGAVIPFARWEALAVGPLVLALAAYGRHRVSRWVIAGCAIVSLASAARGWSRVEAQETTREAAAHALPSPVRCAAHAIVVTSPVRVRGSPRWDADVALHECEGSASAWSGRVTLYGGPEDLARGDEAEIIAQLAPPQRLWNADLDDPRPGEARRGVVRSGGLLDARIVRRDGGITAWIDRVRAHIRARIDATFPEDTAPMARALVLGESDLSSEDDAAFRASGLAHLLAVSGMHLVLVIAGAVAALRALLVRIDFLAARYDVGRIAAGLGVPAAWAYAQLAGASGSAVRAAWMITVTLFARAIGRRSDGVRAFGLSLAAMALVDPLVVFDVSFLLSAGATGGLLAFARPMSGWLEARVPRIAGGVARSVATTVAATLPCAPILARFAPTLPIGGVVANLIAVPLGEAIALPMCLVHALLEPWGAAERGCAAAAAGALRVVRLVARTFANAPGMAVAVPPPTGVQMAAMGLAFAWFLLGPRRARGTGIVVLAAIALLAEIGARRAGAPTGELRVTFLDVGQGDAAIVDLPDGDAIVIDGGGLVGSPIDTGARVVAPVLRARRRDAVGLAVLSHPHPDHFGGLASGLSAARVGALWDSGQGERESMGGGYAALLDAMHARGAPILRPDAFCGTRERAGVRLDVLAPCPGPIADRGPNDNSIVLRIAYGTRAVLFMGDAEHEEEADLLRFPAERLRADVLKIGHHGSRTSSSPAFLRAVAPSEAVISVGARNRFGHPHAETMRALADAAIRVWRTDRDGSVTVRTDGRALDVTTARAR